MPTRPQRQHYENSQVYQDTTILYDLVEKLTKDISSLREQLGLATPTSRSQGISRAVSIPAASDPNALAQVYGSGINPNVTTFSIASGIAGLSVGSSPAYNLTITSAVNFRSAISAAASGANTDITSLASGVAIASGGPKILSGTGTPEGAVTAGVGSIFLRSDGGAVTSIYVKESGSGNTGWVAK